MRKTGAENTDLVEAGPAGESGAGSVAATSTPILHPLVVHVEETLRPSDAAPDKAGRGGGGEGAGGGEGVKSAEDRKREYFASDPYKHFTTVKGEKPFPVVKEKMKIPDQFQVF